MENTYKQPSKQKARIEALTHAVELLTKRRKYCSIVPNEYVSKVISKMQEPDEHDDYKKAAQRCNIEDVKSWQSFHKSSIGQRKAQDLTIAYLAGPEPSNDFEILLNLGVRPENIWAFELEKDTFKSALNDIKETKLRGIKLMNVNIEYYFQSVPRRFDIIYFDACAPLPSHSQKTTRVVTSIFKYAALAPLGVLITNFSIPDISKDNDKYARLIAAYLYPKSFLDTFDDPDHTYTDGAEAHGYSLHPEEDDEDFFSLIKKDFVDYYGSFITRHIVDIASIIVPTVRLVESPLINQIVEDIKTSITRGMRFVNFNNDDDETSTHHTNDSGGDIWCDPSLFSLLHTITTCGLIDNNNTSQDFVLDKKFYSSWVNQLGGNPQSKQDITELILIFYALRHDKELWATPLKTLAKFDYWRQMRFLCDVPTDEIAFFSAFAQIAYPMHNNVKETKRYSYIAEGKSTTMLLDVLPFDECRYIYDWLPTAPLMENDWGDESRQLIFRFALDGLAKNIRWYQDDFFYGCHAVGEDADYFSPPMYKLRDPIKLEI